MTRKPPGLSPRDRPCHAPAPRSAWRQALALALGGLALLVLPAWPQVTADPFAPRDQQPAVLRTGNGLPQVEVTTPSAAGVSRNRYSQFDVPATGVILNNSRVDTPTRLGGWVRGNPWLAAGPARLILNEVNSRNPSQLRGYLEVAGPRTEVVLANPAGLQVDGGGFLNASRAVLTTGTPVFGGSGALEGFRVREGQVEVRGGGLDASTADAAVILARAMSVQGGLWAPELRVALGLQEVDLAVSRVMPLPAEAGALPGPALALDVGALGGMYAGRIFLMASESGVGVRNAGHIHALAGSLQLDTAGTLVNTDTGVMAARQDLRIAADLRNSGALDAGGLLQVTSDRELANTGAIVGAEVALAAGQRISNRGPGALIGATDDSGQLSLLAPVIENADDVTATDTAPATTILGLGHVLLGGGRDARGAPTRASSVINRSGLIESGQGMTVLADSLTNRRRQLVVSSTYDLTPSAEDLARAGIRLSGRVGQVNTPDPHQIGGVYIDPPHGGAWNSDYLYTDYQGVAGMNAVTAISPRGRIVAGGDLDLSGVKLLRNEASDISSGGSINLGGAKVIQDGSGGGGPKGGTVGPLIRVTYSGTYQYRTYKGELWTESFADDVRYYQPSHAYDASLTAHATIRGSGGALVNGGDAGAGPSAAAFSPPALPAAVAVTSSPPWAPPVSPGVPASVPTPTPTPTPAPAPASSVPLPAPSPVAVISPLSTSPLFHQAADSSSGVLMETDPRFTRAREWVSSTHLLQGLGVDPSSMERRLGDGLYEQRLIREQLVARTGSRLLIGYADEDAQYRALMDSAVTQARAVGLVPGVALSAGQVARLTSDIAWLVLQEVELPDGGRRRVLVPQVYLAGASARVRPQGPLVAAALIDLRDQQEVRNGGTLAATGDLRLESRQDIDSRLGKLLAGGALDLSAQADIDLAGAMVRAGSLRAAAGRDLLVAGITQTRESAAQGISRSSTTLVRRADIEVSGDARIATGRDLRVSGSWVAVGGGLAADVGRDLVVDAVQTSEETSADRLGGEARSQFSQHQGSQVEAGGDSAIRVGRDLRVQGSELRLGASETTSADLVVAGEVVLGASLDRAQVDSRYQAGGASGSLHRMDETRQGAVLASSGSLQLEAGKDITVSGSRIAAAGDARLHAGGSVQVLSAEERHTLQADDRGSHQAGLGTRSTTTREEREQTLQRSASIGAGQLSVEAGADLSVRGSHVLADRSLDIDAGGDVRIEASENLERGSSLHEERRSGLFSSRKGVTLGRRSQSEGTVSESRLAQAATVGSVGGSVRVSAGGAYRQAGSDLLAPQGAIDVEARQVEIVEARETHRHQAEQHTRQSGLSVGVSSGIVTSLQGAERSLEAAGHTPDDRMQALARASAALQVYGAYAAATGPDAALPSAARLADSLSLDVSLGSQRADASQERRQDIARASGVQAGGQMSFTARGAGSESRLLTRGARLEAGGDMALQADADVVLSAARNEASERSESSSRSASVGLSVSATGSVSVNAAASRSQGRGEGQDLAWTATEARSAGRLSIASGGDTALEGAVARGRRVEASVGGDLRIESLQDVSRFGSESRSTGFSVSVPLSGAGAGTPGTPGGGAAGSGAGPAGWRLGRNQSQAQGRHASVSEQAGVFAGADGFGVEVQGDTRLRGGALASEAEAARNRLATASLATSDLRNESSASASSRGTSLSSDMLGQGRYGVAKGVAGNLMDRGSAGGSSEGATRAAISPAAVLITDEARQRAQTGQSAAEVVATLHRDAGGAQQAAARIDARALLEQAQAEQTLRNEAVHTFTQFSDPAWRVMFKEPPQFYRVTCPPGADCTRNPELARHERMAGTPEQVRAEIAAAPPGAVLAVNGIQNTTERASVLAMQNARPDQDGVKPATLFLMHYLPTGNAISELMVAGYEQNLAQALGHTNPTLAYANVLEARAGLETTSLGHSRGTLVQTNALRVLSREGVADRDFAVQGLGGPVAAEVFIGTAVRVVDPARADRIEFSYFSNDPIAVIAGGNPGVVSLSELWRVLTTSNSAHSCYGTGASGCRQVQYPVPNAPQGAVQDTSTLIRVTPANLSTWKKP